MQRSTALVIAAYARLDAEAGGVVFHTLYKAFDIEEASTRYWIRQFRDMPTEELLASAQEQLKK